MRVVSVRPRSRKRSGFTLIELLVVISIIAVLMSLILPAIQAARENVRRISCLNRMRNLGVAAHGYSTSHGKLPAYGHFEPQTSLGGGTPDTTPLPPKSGANWVVTLLPYLDRQDIADRWNWNAVGFDPGNDVLSTYNLSVLNCKSDQTADGVPGGLSYVINAGYGDVSRTTLYQPGTAAWPMLSDVHASATLPVDWDADGFVPMSTAPWVDSQDAEVTRSTGLSWMHIGSKNNSLSLDAIYDGGGNTILFGENINAGGAGNWSNPDISNCAFIYPIDVANTNGSNFFNPPLATGYDPRPNAMKNSGEGTPLLSANHRGVVNVIMASGAGSTISENIDPSIFVRLMTPAGSRIRPYPGFAAENPLSDSEF